MVAWKILKVTEMKKREILNFVESKKFLGDWIAEYEWQREVTDDSVVEYFKMFSYDLCFPKKHPPVSTLSAAVVHWQQPSYPHPWL